MAKFILFIIGFLFLSFVSNNLYAISNTNHSITTQIPTPISPAPKIEKKNHPHKWAYKLADKIVNSKMGKKVANMLNLFNFIEWLDPLGFMLGFLLGPLGVLIAYLIKNNQGENFMNSAYIGLGCSLVAWVVIFLIIFVSSY